MPPKIPSPELVGEPIDGAVYALPSGNVLVVGEVPEGLAGRPPLHGGALIIRYALPLLQPPSDAVIPGLFAAEKGGMLVGREAWDYIQRQFQVHPRADVVGLGVNGKQMQVFLREVDLGAPVRVLVYENAEATTPAAEIGALLIGADALPLPDLLARYLPLTDVEALLDGSD